MSAFAIAYVVGYAFIALLIYLVRRRLTPSGRLLALRFGPPAADEDPTPKARFQYAAYLGLLSVFCLGTGYAAFMVGEQFSRVATFGFAIFFMAFLLGLVFATGAIVGAVQALVALLRSDHGHSES